MDRNDLARSPKLKQLRTHAHRLRAFLHYYRRACTRFRLHSPFAYALVTATLDDDRHFYAFDEIDWLFRQLRKSKEPLEPLDLGAGSLRHPQKRTTAGAVFRTAGSSRAFYHFLFRLILFFQPHSILELGTNLGLSALSMHRARQKARLITIEGCPHTAALARKLFAERRARIELLNDDFATALPRALQSLGRVDFALIDGNHRKKATIDYFQQILPYTHPRSVLFFDDIHWSPGMTEAWKQIKAHPKVRFSADFFFGGLVAFRSEQVVPLHLSLIARKYKPWQMGFVE